jgi:hypothetical protein
MKFPKTLRFIKLFLGLNGNLSTDFSYLFPQFIIEQLSHFRPATCHPYLAVNLVKKHLGASEFFEIF